MKDKWKSLQLFAEGAEGGEAAPAEAAESAAQESGNAEPAGAEARIQLLEQQLGTVLEQLKQPEDRKADPALVQLHWQGVDQIYEALAQQAEGLKQLYPDFDLAQELRDRRFAGMLRAGVDMRSAFHAIHGDEILPAAMQYAARVVEQRLSGAMRAGVDRPAENGLHGSGAVRMGSEVSRLTRADYDKICRMVERGERVSFG